MKTELINTIGGEKANTAIAELEKVPMTGTLWIKGDLVRVYFERAGKKGYVDLIEGKYYADKDKAHNWKFMHDLMDKTNFKY